jgi:hypothetical protein
MTKYTGIYCISFENNGTKAQKKEHFKPISTSSTSSDSQTKIPFAVDIYEHKECHKLFFFI